MRSPIVAVALIALLSGSVLSAQTPTNSSLVRLLRWLMATPAISDGLIVVRTLGHVYGIGQ